VAVYFSSFSLRYAAAFLLAACLLSCSAVRAQQPASPASPAQQPGAAPDPHAAQELAAQRQALGFLGYLDAGRFADSYAYTSALLRAKTVQSTFVKEVQKDRSALGAKQSRKLLNASYTTSLQGQPAGQYVVLQYGTDFANKKNAVETVVLSFENNYWRVAGWYVKEQPSG
jgi:Protein of unknown function (DUF4019)